MRDIGGRLTEKRVEGLIGMVAALLGTVVHGRARIVEGELPVNGSRFEGILPPVSTAPTFVIRKRASQIYGLEDYVRAGILTTAQQKVLLEAVRDRQNIVIAGGTASGKTTLANALMREIVARGDPTERIVILEDTRELQCEARNAVQLHTGDVADLTRLVRVTMRLRPDRIIVGEVRGGEALALLKAWNTGHPGGITTVHANSAAAALLRLDSLIQESGVPPQPSLVAETVDVVVVIVRTRVRAGHCRRDRPGSGLRLHRARVRRPAALRCRLWRSARPGSPQFHDGGRLGRSDLLMDEPRRAPIHPSLTRPLLLGGAERELVLVNGTLIAALVVGVGFHLVSLTIAGLLASVGHWALTRAAKYDARLSRIYIRHVRYQPYYPARAPLKAPPAWVYPSVED